MRGQTNASNVGGTVGDDTHPVKSVDGVLTPVSKAVLTADGGKLNRNKPIIFDSDPYNAGIQINASSSDGNNIQILNVYNNQGVALMGLYLSYDGTNGVRLNASVRNANGTYRYIAIA